MPKLLGASRYRRLRHPEWLARFIRPVASHWSGLQFRCWRHGDAEGVLRVIVWRISLRGVARVRTQELPLAAIDDRALVPVYWSPIVNSARRWFFVLIRQVRQVPAAKADQVPLHFTWRRDGCGDE